MNNFDPFQILGVPNEMVNDLDFIKERYKHWMLFLHPDKGNFQGPETDRIELFQSIQDAYKLITSGQQIREYPTENIEYRTQFEDETIQLQFRNDFIKGSSHSIVNKKFHRTFEKIQQQLDEEDPAKRGYQEFNSRKVITDRDNITISPQTYSPDDIFTRNENRFLDAVPKRYTQDSHELTLYGTTELGTNEIHDLSIQITGSKHGITGTDIGTAFTNQITSEEDVMKFKQKYENTGKTLNQLMNERQAELSTVIEPLPEDTQKMESMRKLDLARQHIQRERDAKRAQISSLLIKDWKET